jgi:glycosyltransferase involved in cell wall biosynthesis
MDLGATDMMGQVVILTSEPTEAPGGMEHVLRELQIGLRAHGYAVTVLHRENGAPRWVARPRNKWTGYVADAALSWYLGRQVRKFRGPHLVAILSNGPFGWYLPRLPATVRKIHFYHGTYRRQADAIRPFITFLGALKLKWWDSMILERQSGRGKLVVCNSDQTRHEVQEYFGYSGETAWLPLDTNHFTPLDKLQSRRELGLPETEKIGVFVGSSLATKGFSTVRKLIDAFPEVHWCLALRGDIPGDLATNGALSIFHNAGREMLPSLYNAADFAVCPSLYESFGYVVAEGLACGVPVVASRGGASDAFLRHTSLEYLAVTEAGSSRDFERAIRMVLADPDRHREMVVRLIRPEIERKMSLENWLRYFQALTRL